MSKTLDIYIRVSQVKGRDKDGREWSPDDQEGECRGAMERLGFAVGEVNKSDLDKSGGTAEREGFQRVLSRIEAGVVDGIAVVRADRFARSPIIGLQAVERIKAVGGVFLSATENVDVNSADGEMVFTILMAVAKYQRTTTMIGLAKAQANALERGVPPTRLPYGLHREQNDRGRYFGAVLLDEEKASHVRYAFERRAEGCGWALLARELGERTGFHWPTSRVRWTIKNRAYVGELNFAGKRYTDLPAIVSETLWQSANRSRGVAQVSKGDDLLTGFLRCQGCRQTLKSRWQAGHHYYGCNEPRPHERASVRADEMLALLRPALRSRHELVLEGLEGAFDMAALSEALSEAETSVEQLVRLAAKSGKPELYEAGIEEAEEILRERKAEFDRAQVLSTVDGVPMLFSWDEAWEDSDTEGRRHMIDALLDCVIVKRGERGADPDGRALVLWRGTAPKDLPRRGVGGPLRSFPWPEDPAGVPSGEQAAAHLGEGAAL